MTKANSTGMKYSPTARLPGPKKGALVGKTKRGKGTKLMVVADGQGEPLGVELAPASPHEATLIERLLAQIHVLRTGPGRPRCRFPRLIYDRAADSDRLRDWLAQRGVVRHFENNFLMRAVLKKNPRAKSPARGFFGSLKLQRGSRPNSDSSLNNLRIIGILLLSADLVLTRLFRRYRMSIVTRCF